MCAPHYELLPLIFLGQRGKVSACFKSTQAAAPLLCCSVCPLTGARDIPLRFAENAKIGEDIPQ